MAKALTAFAVDSAKLAEVRQEKPDGKQRGLYLVVQPSGVKSWCVRYRHSGKNRKLTLGPYPAIDLKLARELALQALTSVALGKDPAADKKAERLAAQRDLYEDVAALFIEKYAKAQNRKSTSYRMAKTLQGEVLEAWKGRSVGNITKRDVIELLDKVVERGSPVMANRVHAMIRRFFNWCIERGILNHSPCDRIKSPTVEHSRDRVLTDAELVEVWRAANEVGYPYGSFVQMLILTGQRRDEVSRMTWDEIDLEKRIWCLPRERVKNKKAHEVPLSDAVVAILRSLPRVSDTWVFTVTGDYPVNSFSMRKRELEKLIGDSVRPWALHDLRRTMATGLARLGVNLPVIEKVLNHQSGSLSGVAGIYNRYEFAEEKREAMERWAQHVAGLLEG